MIRHIQQQDLHGAKQQRGFHPRRLGGRALIEVLAEQMTERSKAAQYGGDQPSDQGAVALRKRGEARMGVPAVELLIERPPAAQYTVEYVSRNPSCGKARWFLRRGANAFGHPHGPCGRPTPEWAPLERAPVSPHGPLGGTRVGDGGLSPPRLPKPEAEPKPAPKPVKLPRCAISAANC